MTLSALIVQLVNGLASASTLFLVAAGLSLIFGVTRIVNFAHGSIAMVGLYVACTLSATLSGGAAASATATGFWAAVAIATLAGAGLGALIELAVLRRIYRAPELFQLLATYALVLLIGDATLYLWGPEDLLGPKAPGLRGALELLGRPVPTYDLLLIAIGPTVGGALWLMLTRTRFGVLIRAATEDREMLGALGVDQRWLFTAVFALGSALAAAAGALQMPREPAHLGMDLEVVGDAFVVVVVGGLGSIPGALLAAVLIAEVKALCYALGTVHLFGIELSLSRWTLVAEFAVMAATLAWRPSGLLGRPWRDARQPAQPGRPAPASGGPAGGPRRGSWWSGSILASLGLLAAVALLPLLVASDPYLVVLATEILIAALFAASLQFIMGPGGMPSFGHAAYFGIGAYGVALLLRHGALPIELALAAAGLLGALAAALFGLVAARLSGVYLAMLTLAAAQIVWAIVYQWDEVTGGSNGLVGIRAPARLASSPARYVLVAGCVCAGVIGLQRARLAPFGHALRASRDSALRAAAIGIDAVAVRRRALVLAGAGGGVAGALYAIAKGTISPDTIAVGRSIDGLMMVLLGGLQSSAGPLLGAAAFTGLQDVLIRSTAYWRAAFGGVLLALVLLFPDGLAGAFASLTEAWRWRNARRGADR